MAKENGKMVKGLNAISMKESMQMIRSTGMGFSNGQVEIRIKENIKMMKEMDMVR